MKNNKQTDNKDSPNSGIDSRMHWVYLLLFYLGMERTIELKQRGLTPRHISSQTKSRIIQVAAQYQSDNDKRRHKLVANLNDHVEEEYAAATKERIRESLNGECTSNRLIDLEGLKGGVAATLCRPCVEAKIHTLEQDTILEFEKYFFANEGNMSPSDIFKSYKRSQGRSKKREYQSLVSKAQMSINDQTIGQSSNITLHCSNKIPHQTAINKLLDRRMTHKKGRLGLHDTNLRIMMAPFFAGIGPREMTDVANVLDLPNSKNLDRTLSRHQPEIGAAIIKISEREMRIAMAEEIRYTIIAEKGEEYYKQWENLPLEERDTVGLVISYDMG